MQRTDLPGYKGWKRAWTPSKSFRPQPRQISSPSFTHHPPHRLLLILPPSVLSVGYVARTVLSTIPTQSLRALDSPSAQLGTLLHTPDDTSFDGPPLWTPIPPLLGLRVDTCKNTCANVIGAILKSSSLDSLAHLGGFTSRTTIEGYRGVSLVVLCGLLFEPRRSFYHQRSLLSDPPASSHSTLDVDWPSSPRHFQTEE